MAYPDMNRCPQTDSEMRDYFFALIGRNLGAPANDYASVLSASYMWQGMPMMIPAGVGPGIKQPANAPFFGLTQQYSGGPKCRVFLPTNTPDELGYYTRCDQYVDDDPAGQGGLVWAWYLAGPENAYAPVLPADVAPPDGGTTPPASGLTEADVQRMIDASLVDVVKYGERIGLRSSGDPNSNNDPKLLCAEHGGPDADNQPFELTGRSGNPGPWESWNVERGQ